MTCAATGRQRSRFACGGKNTVAENAMDKRTHIGYTCTQIQLWPLFDNQLRHQAFVVSRKLWPCPVRLSFKAEASTRSLPMRYRCAPLVVIPGVSKSLQMCRRILRIYAKATSGVQKYVGGVLDN
jgi:ribosomal protein S14